MSLFQKSVLKKYLKGLEAEKTSEAYERFTNHFHNPTIQENIRNANEEQYQEGFLRDLFVNVLGYTLNPDKDFNLTTELKNIKDSKKTDGAILSRGLNPLDSKALAVIELKGTNTTDLSKVESQAFGYKNNQPDCNYVITSNFEKLRFYIDNTVDFEEFNLFQLSKERFEILCLCLSADYLLKDIPKKIKNESVTQEENVTKKLYKDYSEFRNEIFDSIQKENPEYDKLTLFKKTQKLLDRFLFIFFAEDRLLLPPNSIRSIISQWTDLRDKYDEYFPLYNRFKKYFGYMNTGHKGQKHDIFSYNGGLFAPDEILDNIKINDDLLYKHTLNLSNYDFESEVSVNILGHIFEHSLTDIENIQAKIEGAEIDKSKTKRKKDGVFYTPKYITKYIVENTIGKLCEEKKIELDINDENYRPAKQRSRKRLDNLQTYRDWLLQITICDPACGSGAFLNQALEFLIAEHGYIDELSAKYNKDALVLSEVENSILENNLFGVDINEESVEIAKLSLWLRTAQKGRKLTALNNNIKCGNSLIDDPNVAGDKAFNWQQEFPNVFIEKNKKAYHITTAIHDSRTSARMKKYKVRERRDLGTNPYPNVIYFTPEDDLLITQTIADIVKQDRLNLLAYNICADHIHLLLVCNIEEIPAIMQKIKSISSRITREHAPLQKGKVNKPLWQQKYSAPKEITSQEQLYNTIKYIQTNRSKHELPAHTKKTQAVIDQMCCGLDNAFKPEYTGDFDVVIGNPPYAGRSSSINEKEKTFVKKRYSTTEGKFELYQLFIEKCFELTKTNNSFISLITPQTWLSIIQATKLRKLVLSRQELSDIIFLGKNVFEDASVDSVVFIINKNTKHQTINFSQSNILLNEKFENLKIQYRDIDKKTFAIPMNSTADSSKVFSKIYKSSILLDEVGKWSDGIKVVGPAKSFAFQQNKFNETFHPMILGKDIEKYRVKWSGLYCCRDKESIEAYNATDIRLREEKMFQRNKILIRKTGNEIVATIDINKLYYEQSLFSYGLNSDSKYNLESILGILNSKVADFLLRENAFSKKDTFPQIRLHWLKEFPLPKKNINSKLEEIVKEIQQSQEHFSSFIEEFTKYLQSKFSIEKLSRKLQNWHELEFGEFLKELEKARKKVATATTTAFSPLPLQEQAEWMQYFNKQKEKALSLKAEIDNTDSDIDQLVYELYGLTPEEIAIVEKATK